MKRIVCNLDIQSWLSQKIPEEIATLLEKVLMLKNVLQAYLLPEQVVWLTAQNQKVLYNDEKGETWVI